MHPSSCNSTSHQVCTDLPQAYMSIKFRILKQMGENLETDAKVFRVNNYVAIVSSLTLIWQ